MPDMLALPATSPRIIRKSSVSESLRRSPTVREREGNGAPSLR